MMINFLIQCLHLQVEHMNDSVKVCKTTHTEIPLLDDKLFGMF